VTSTKSAISKSLANPIQYYFDVKVYQTTSATKLSNLKVYVSKENVFKSNSEFQLLENPRIRTLDGFPADYSVYANPDKEIQIKLLPNAVRNSDRNRVSYSVTIKPNGTHSSCPTGRVGVGINDLLVIPVRPKHENSLIIFVVGVSRVSDSD